MGLFPKEANFIKSIVLHGCARPWYVYAETFLPAWLELVITVGIFDIEDAIRAHGEKIVSEGAGKRTRGGKHTQKIRVNVVETKAARYARLGLKTLLIVTKPIELIGFTWLLYSAVDQFFFNWQSMIEESDFCKQPINSGPFNASRGAGFVSILPGGSPVPMTTVDQNRATWVNTSISIELPEGLIGCLFGLTCGAPPGGITGVRIQLRITDFLRTYFFESDPVDIAPGTTEDLIISTTFFLATQFGGSVVWELKGPAVPAGIFCGKAHVIFYRKG